MTANESLYQPLRTEEIPLPVVEARTAPREGESPLPRILLQAVGRGAARRRLLLLAGVFLLVSGLEIALLVRWGSPSPLVVYENPPKRILTEVVSR